MAMHSLARSGPRAGLSLIACAALLALAACGGSDDNDDDGGNTGPPPSSKYSADIRRTEMGVPHVKAAEFMKSLVPFNPPDYLGLMWDIRSGYMERGNWIATSCTCLTEQGTRY